MTTKVAMGFALICAALGCAPEADEGEEIAPADTAAATTKPEDETATGEGAANVVTYEATDFAFTGPTQVPAGLTTVRIENSGSVVHHVQILRLEGERSASDVSKAFTGKGPAPDFPAWAVPVGGVGAPRPGADASATVRLEPGHYAVVCVIPVPDGIPHVAKGMALDLEVLEEGATEASLPDGSVSIQLRDYAFQVSGALAAGEQTLRVRNAGTEPHEVQLFRMAPGKGAPDVLAWARDGFSEPPPGEPIGGVAALAPGREAALSADFTPGAYALVCFVPAPDGKLHLEHGMVTELEVG